MPTCLRFRRFLSPLALPITLAVFLAFSGRVRADCDDLVAEAEMLYGIGDYRGALENFRRASWERPQDADLHYNIGVLAEALGENDEAVESYLAYLRWGGGSSDQGAVKRRVFQLCGRLGSKAYQQKRYGEAANWYTKAGTVFPDAREVFFNLGMIYESMGELRPAIESSVRYWRMSTGAERRKTAERIAMLCCRQGKIHLQKGRVEAALASFDEAERWDDRDPEILLYMARCEQRLSLLEKATDHFASYLKKAPNSAHKKEVLSSLGRLYRVRAEAYLSAGNPERAEEMLLKGVLADPEDRDMRYLLAQTYRRLNEPAQALTQLDVLCRLTPREDLPAFVRELVDLSMLLADTSFADKDFASTVAFLKKAQFWDPDNPSVELNLAEAYDRMQDWRNAVQTYQRVLFLMPGEPEMEQVKARMAYLLFVEGSREFSRGNYGPAREVLEQALLLRPHDPSLLYNVALVYLKLGDSGTAIHFFGRYLEYETDPAEIKRTRGQLAALLGGAVEDKGVGGAARPSMPDRTAQAPGDPAASAYGLRRQAYLLLKSGLWRDAVSEYEKHVLMFPVDREDESLQAEFSAAYRELGRSELLEGDPSAGLASLQKAKQWSPSEPSLYLWEGDVYENLRNADRAIQVYQESMRAVTDPEIRRTLRAKIAGILKGRLQDALRSKDYRAALETLSEMTPYLSDRERKEIGFQKAEILTAMGLKDQARIEYGLFLQDAPRAQSDPDSVKELAARTEATVDPAGESPAEYVAEGKRRLAELYGKGLYEEGIKTLDALQRVAPDEDLAFLKGVFQEMSGRNEDAMEHYKVALNAPGSSAWVADARNRLCDLMVRASIREYERGNAGKSLSLLEEARAILPERRDVAFNLGCVHFKEKDPSKAFDAFSRYIMLTPEESPRKTLTIRAMDVLVKQLTTSSAVRVDNQGAALDFVFETSPSLGRLLSSNDPGDGQKELLDGVLLAPYLEKPLEREDAPALAAALGQRG